jgi:hypothetical protein
MADYTLAEAQALLTKVNIAIEAKITNTRFASFTTGTTEFSHKYEFDTTTMQELLDLRKQLLDIIGSYETPAPVFRANGIFGVIARKGDL